MNSEMRILTPAAGPETENGSRSYAWTYEVFVNAPVLIGLIAKGPEAGKSIYSDTPWWDLGPLARSAVRGIEPCDPRFHRRLVVFERYHRPVLARVPPGVDYHFPEGLGGVGIPSHDEEPVENNLALRRAAWLSCLDVRTRAKANTPPTVSHPGIWFVVEKDIKSLPHLVRERIVDVPDVPTLERLQARRTIGSAQLANYVRAANDTRLLARTPDEEKHLVVPQNWKSNAVVLLERRRSWTISKQVRSAVNSSLQPMSLRTVGAWKSSQVIEQTTEEPRYEVPVVL